MNDFLTYGWVAVVGLVGGILGLGDKQKDLSACPSKACLWAKIICGVASSMFVCYIVYELAYFYLGATKPAVAIAGVGAWMGANALLMLQEFLTKFLNNKTN